MSDLNAGEFFARTLEDIEQELAGCRCGCSHRSKLDGLVVVATLDGNPFIYDGAGEDTVALLERAARVMRGERSGEAAS